MLQQSGGRNWGMRVYRGPEGHVQVDTSYEGAELVEAGVRPQGPVGLMLGARTHFRATGPEAREVQAELIRPMMRLSAETLRHEAAGTGETFLLRLGLIGVTEEEWAKLPR